MAKKRKKKTKGPSFEIPLQDEVLHTVLAIVLFVLAGFLLLSSIGLAGVAGEKVYESLVYLFGIGYFLFPLVLVLLGISYFKSEKPSIAWTSSIGAVVMFASGLAIIDIALYTQGGVVGRFISAPLISLLDVYASLLILWALVFISLLVLFDAKPTVESFSILQKMRARKERAEEEEEDFEVSVPSEPEEDISEEEPASEEPEEETPKKEASQEEESGLSIFGGKKRAVLSSYTPPPLSLLEKRGGKPEVGDIKANANLIKRTLQNFGITVEMDEISIGPSVTRYALKPAEGVRLSKILGLQNNLELALAAHPVRIEAPIPGKSLVGIEVPNTAKTTVGLHSIIGSPEFQKSTSPLTIALGRGIAGNTHTANIEKMPHLLIAGATGSGKSVTIHNLITSLLYRNSPEDMKLIMVDPKRVELTLYNGIPHLLTPVITDAKKTILALKWAAQEMDRRYDILEESKVRDISSYHKEVWMPALKKELSDEERPAQMPYIVVVIDELADIMQAYPRELEAAIVRLAQMSRAVGIHLVLSTQRPSVNVITGLIKANVPTRIALQVASQIDSRTILDTSGAEKLLGSGDLLYMSGDMSKPIRIQSAFISEKEVKGVVKYLKDNYEDELPDEVTFSEEGPAQTDIFDTSLDEGEEDDDMYEEARDTVIRAGKASTSYLQRKLRVGYARAARLMDILEENGVVGPQDGSKPREVLMDYGGEPEEESLDEEASEENSNNDEGHAN